VTRGGSSTFAHEVLEKEIIIRERKGDVSKKKKITMKEVHYQESAWK
jgi:hypothetical protein